VNKAFPITPARLAVLALALGLSACSSTEGLLSGDKIDYGKAARKTNPLEVPPDLSPLNRDGRYLPQSTNSVSANQLQQQAGQRPAAAGAATVAPQQIGAMRIERDGSTRFLVSPQTPEQLYPKIRQFWEGLGFTLVKDAPESGTLETEWAENRAKIPSDLIRNTIGKVFDSFYSTGERDKFRTRLERGPAGTEITIGHRGLQEVFTGQREETTVWTARATDPQLEAEMLTRLMIALGAPEEAARAEQAKASVATPAAAAPTGPARVRELTDQPGAALALAEPMERAWRRVGLALDRSGFTVEDRDRGQAVYFVRFADPKTAGKEDPNFFAKLFGAKDPVQLARFRVGLQAGADGQTVVRILDQQGAPDATDNGKRVASLLLEELRR
jgi:outer membrane protein assembly factor BamC